MVSQYIPNKIKLSAKITILILLFTVNCTNDKQKATIIELKNEISVLTQKNQKLEVENNILKTTADFHYKNGITLFSNEKYQEAKNEFEEIINMFPTSPLVSMANKKIAETDARIVQLAKLKEEEEIKQRLAKEKVERERGEDISYVDWYTTLKSNVYAKTKRYRFKTWLQTDNYSDGSLMICLTDNPTGSNPRVFCGVKTYNMDPGQKQALERGTRNWQELTIVVECQMGNLVSLIRIEN